MSKKYHLFITALFCLFLGGFLIWHLALPDADFSPNENRYLDQLPTPTFGMAFLGVDDGNFFTGEFMQDFESYVNDQFPLRDGWVALKARAEQLSGKQSNNGVYFGSGGSLIADYPAPDPELVEKNLGYVSALGEKLSVPVYFSLIPGKSEAWKPLLPEGAPVGNQNAILEQASKTEHVTWIDVQTPFTVTADGRSYSDYYFTDHHWTTAGAYYGYADLMEGMGLTAHPLGELTTVTEEFYGTTWSKAGAYWYKPDSIEIAVSDEDVTVTSTASGAPEPGALYHYDRLAEKDKYSFFLGGNQPLCVIQSEKEGAQGRLLVIRDSYSDSLAPFLTQNFAEIHLLDARYYKTPIGMYVQQNRIDNVLVLYSVDNFVTDSNLFVLSM